MENTNIIRVNVPGTTGFYRFLLSGFYSDNVDNAAFKRMLKAVSADTENLTENVSAILAYVPEKYCKNYQERKKAVSALLETKTAEEKHINKLVQAFSDPKNKRRPALQKPFLHDGILYACDSWHAVMVSDSSAYTGDVYTELEGCTPNMAALFKGYEHVQETFSAIELPDLKTIKKWDKGSNRISYNKVGAAFCIDHTHGYLKTKYLINCMNITGSNTVYVNMNSDKPGLCFMFGNGFVCIILALYAEKLFTADALKNVPENSLFIENTDHTVSVLELEQKQAMPKTETVSVSVQEKAPETVSEPMQAAETEPDPVKETVQKTEPAAEPEKETVSVPETETEKDKTVIRLAGCDIYKYQAEKAIKEHELLVKGFCAYTIEKTVKGSYKAKKQFISLHSVPIVKRGTFCFMDREYLQKLLPEYDIPDYYSENPYAALREEKAMKQAEQTEKVSSSACYETVSANIEPVKETETVSAETVIDLKEFRGILNKKYNYLYEYSSPDQYRYLVNRFDNCLNEYEKSLLQCFIKYRGDIVSSDREAAAFCLAYDEIILQRVSKIQSCIPWSVMQGKAEPDKEKIKALSAGYDPYDLTFCLRSLSDRQADILEKILFPEWDETETETAVTVETEETENVSSAETVQAEVEEKLGFPISEEGKAFLEKSSANMETVSAIDIVSSIMDPAGKEFTNDVTVYANEEKIAKTIPSVQTIPERSAYPVSSASFVIPVLHNRNTGSAMPASWHSSASGYIPVIPDSVLPVYRHETGTLYGNYSRSVNERIRPPTYINTKYNSIYK